MSGFGSPQSSSGGRGSPSRKGGPPGRAPRAGAGEAAFASPAEAYSAGRAERRKPRDVANITENLRSQAKELMEQAEKDGLFDALKPPGGARAGPPSVQELYALFDTEVVVAVWRRTAYTMGEYPRCLNGSFAEKTVSCQAFENIGSSWKFVPVRRGPGDGPPPAGGVLARLECVEVGRQPLALLGDLSLSKTRGAGCDWFVAPAEPFRGDPNDLPVTIAAPDGRLLCANPKAKSIALVAPGDLDLRDVEGDFIFNVAWECSLMSAQRDDDPSLAFLDDYMKQIEEETNTTPF